MGRSPAFRPASAYTPLSVFTVLRLLRVGRAYDRDLFLVLYCLPYSDRGRGTGTSLRQLCDAYREGTGSTTSKDRVRDALGRLEADGLVSVVRKGKCLSVRVETVTPSDHTRTTSPPVTSSDHTRTRPGRAPGVGWRDRSLRVTTTGHSECPVTVTPSDHTRDKERHLEGCPDRTSYLGVLGETAADGGALGGTPPAARAEGDVNGAEGAAEATGRRGVPEHARGARDALVEQLSRPVPTSGHIADEREARERLLVQAKVLCARAPAKAEVTAAPASAGMVAAKLVRRLRRER